MTVQDENSLDDLKTIQPLNSDWVDSPDYLISFKSRYPNATIDEAIRTAYEDGLINASEVWEPICNASLSIAKQFADELSKDTVDWTKITKLIQAVAPILASATKLIH